MTLGQQFDGQLKLFMTPEEIIDHVNISIDKQRDEDMSDMWSRKLEESKRPQESGHGSGVYDALSSGNNIIHGPQGTGKVPIFYGARSPINGEESRELTDMHHRVASLAEIDKQSGTQTYLNVDHKETMRPKGRRF